MLSVMTKLAHIDGRIQMDYVIKTHYDTSRTNFGVKIYMSHVN